MKMLLRDIASAAQGSLPEDGANLSVDGVSIDSRTIVSGNLFVPLVAERDGHEFIAAAYRNGAAAHLSDRATGIGREVVVADTAAALRQLADAVRPRLGDGVIGVTGSTGKTSTKNMLATMLCQRGPAGYSERSFNNELGVPLTMLNAPDGAWATVIEMGARGKGHIGRLCATARPNTGVITNIGVAHLGEFGSVAAIAEAKGELLEALPTSGLAVLNADDPMYPVLARRSAAPVLGFGEGGDGGPLDVRAAEVTLDAELRAEFRLVSPWGDVRVRLGARGRHQVSNALAAAAVGLHLGLALEDISMALARATLSPGRMQLVTCRSGAFVINDAYNANPASMKAGIEALCALGQGAGETGGRIMAVLGVMAELGPKSTALHEEIGRYATERGVAVVAVGAPAYGGGVDGRVTHVADASEAMGVVGELGPGDCVLVKGSLVAGLQPFAARLVERAGGAAADAAPTGLPPHRCDKER